MYAIVSTGGKQYRVERGQSLLVERLPVEDGGNATLRPLLFVDGDNIVDGEDLAKVTVQARVVGHERGPKLRVVKFKPKRGYKRRTGHRQELTRIEVTEIKLASRRPSSRSAPKPVAADAGGSGAEAAVATEAGAPAEAGAEAAAPAEAGAKPEAGAEAAAAPEATPKPARRRSSASSGGEGQAKPARRSSAKAGEGEPTAGADAETKPARPRRKKTGGEAEDPKSAAAEDPKSAAAEDPKSGDAEDPKSGAAEDAKNNANQPEEEGNGA